MTTGIVHTQRHDGGVTELKLDRPPVNALNSAFLAEIHRVLDELADDAHTRALLLTGAGKTLSAGMDLKELQTFTAEDQRAMVIGLNATYGRLYGFPKPVVCAAHGAAIAGGMFFVLASDYRVAGEHARFGLAEVRVAVRFPVGPFEIARRELSPDACRRLLLGGQAHDAATALALGAVDAAIPPLTFAETKRQIRGEALDRIAAAVDGSADPMLAGWFTEETAEATQSMLTSLKR